MDGKLFATALTKFAAGVVVIGLLLFLPAGTIFWWQGWLFMGVLFVPMFVAGLVMMAKAPDLLRKRLSAKEDEGEQRTVLALSALMFVAAFVVAGLGFRFGWPQLPAWASWVGAVLFLAAYALYAEVMRENAYLSRTIEVQGGQRVVDTGLYGIVRHPMYSATLLLFLSMPIVLGSPFSFVIMLAYLQYAMHVIMSFMFVTMIFVMLLRCDIRKVLRLGPRMLTGFLSATATIMLGFIGAFIAMKGIIGDDAWMGLGALCGSWIGGSGGKPPRCNEVFSS